MRPLWYKFLSKLVHCINSRHCMLRLILGWQTSAFPCKSHSKVSVVPPLNSLHTSLKYITELKDELFYLVWKVSTITYSSKNINRGVQVITRNLKTLEKTKFFSFSQPCIFFFSNFSLKNNGNWNLDYKSGLFWGGCLNFFLMTVDWNFNMTYIN